MPPKLVPSEFEAKTVHPFGSYSTQEAKDKLKYAMRTGLDPDVPPVNLEAAADDFGTGGLRKSTDKIS